MTREIARSLAWAVGLMGLALASTIARQIGYIDADAASRMVIGAAGLMVAWYGNRMPKAVAPNACTRKIARLGGWSLVISGLTYTGLWVFAPIDTALMFGCGVIVAGISATFGHGLILRTKTRTA